MSDLDPLAKSLLRGYFPEAASTPKSENSFTTPFFCCFLNSLLNTEASSGSRKPSSANWSDHDELYAVQQMLRPDFDCFKHSPETLCQLIEAM